MYNMCSVVTSEDCVILGGTKQEGNWNTKPDPSDSLSIQKGCYKLVPGLKVSTSLSHSVTVIHLG
jgi:hypothetical protein